MASAPENGTSKAQSSPDPHRGVPAFLHKMHESLLGRYATGLAIAAFILVAKDVFAKHQVWYERIELETYKQIQRNLVGPTGKSSPIALIDISNIPRITGQEVSVPEDGDTKDATSRASLLQLIHSLVALRPRAIAIDLDFSGSNSGNPVTERDDQFFRDCRSIWQKAQIPIFLGVYRRASQSSDDWLGDAKNRDLAVGLGIGTSKYQEGAHKLQHPIDEILRMFCWTQVGDQTQLKSLAFACARAGRHESSESEDWSSKFIEAESKYNPAGSFKTLGFLVDFRGIDPFVDSAVPYDSIKSVAEKDINAFRDKIVILGSVRRIADEHQELEKTSDLFRVPGHSSIYSGVALHASAVDTLIDAPLMQWTELGGIAADLALALVAMSLIEWLSVILRRSQNVFAQRKSLSWIATFLVSTLTCIVALPLVRYVRLAWDDAFFVAAGLIIHNAVENAISSRLGHRSGHTPPEEPKKQRASNEDDQVEPISRSTS